MFSFRTFLIILIIVMTLWYLNIPPVSDLIDTYVVVNFYKLQRLPIFREAVDFLDEHVFSLPKIVFIIPLIFLVFKEKIFAYWNRFAIKFSIWRGGDNSALVEDVIDENSRNPNYYKKEKMYNEAAEGFLQAGNRFEAAKMFQMANKFFEAAKLYKQLYNYNEAAKCYAMAGKNILSAECYQQAKDISMAAAMYKKGEDYTTAGDLYLELDRPDRAEDCFTQLQAGTEEFFRGLEKTADYYVKHKNWAKAIENYKQMLEGKNVNTNTIEIWYKLARSIEQLSGGEAAVDIYEKISQANHLYKDVRERLAKIKPKAAEPSLLSEEKVNKRYEIIEELGRGGMGIVYKAKDTLLDRIVAYKVLSARFENTSLAAEFLREAKCIAKLEHQNIVHVYDFGDSKESSYIVMEFIDGYDLKAICEANEQFIFPSFKRIFSQVAAGLAFAHSRKIVHRDIKPLNIMLSRSGIVKIMDFGLAKIVEEANVSNSVIKGTPYFMAPEQIMGQKDVDWRVDIFALGVTMYYLLAGNHYPFETGEVLYHNVHTKPPELKDRNPLVSDELNRIVMKCMEKDRSMRYQSALELKSDIDALPSPT